MTKSISNLNTLNALIRDEGMANKEYLELANAKDTTTGMKVLLTSLAKDEARHKKELMKYKRWLIARRK